MILAIDPGPTESAYVVCWGDAIESFGKVPNDRILDIVDPSMTSGSCLAIEMIQSFGMPVGKEVFETCVMIGRIIQRWGHPFKLIYRSEVKHHICGSTRAKDSNVRAALIDMWGGKLKAIGSKKQPGPLRGISGDVWSALAVAVTYADLYMDKENGISPSETIG